MFQYETTCIFTSPSLDIFKISGKTCPVNVGHNKTRRKHLNTITKEGDIDEKPKYLHHYESGETGVDVGLGMFNYIQGSNSETTLRAIGSDQTGSMSSPKIGAHAFVETHLERALQRIFCMLHMCELPARHLFEVSYKFQY